MKVKSENDTLVGILSDAESYAIDYEINGVTHELLWSRLMTAAETLGLSRCELYDAPCDGGSLLGTRVRVGSNWTDLEP